MIDLFGEIRRRVGSKGEAASATGSVLARLAEVLTNRLTTTRAGNLDLAVSAIPAASDYTSTRAALLDRAGIKSIQSGSLAVVAVASATATITSVDTTKSVIYIRHVGPGAGGADNFGGVRGELTNATTVTGYCNNGGGSGNGTVYWTVVEYF